MQNAIISILLSYSSYKNQLIEINSLGPNLWISHDWARAQPCKISFFPTQRALLHTDSSVSSAVGVAGLRRSRRWKSRMWRSWAGVVRRGLRLWGRLDVLSNSLKWCWMWLMVEKWTFNSLATALGDNPTVSMSITCSLNFRHLWHSVVTKLHIWKWFPAQGGPV